MHKTVLAQVADLLLEESSRKAGNVELSQAAIATLLGSSRQTVNEAIGALRDMRAVETAYRSITVLNPSLLAEVVAADRG